MQVLEQGPFLNVCWIRLSSKRISSFTTRSGRILQKSDQNQRAKRARYIKGRVARDLYPLLQGHREFSRERATIIARGLSLYCRAQEKLYPLSKVFQPVSQFFLEREKQTDFEHIRELAMDTPGENRGIQNHNNQPGTEVGSAVISLRIKIEKHHCLWLSLFTEAQGMEQILYGIG